MSNNKKITKLSDLNSVNGKVETGEPTTIEQILGKKFNLGKYRTDNLEEYLAGLEDKNNAELRTEALTLGAFIPNGDRKKLVKQLEREFLKYHSVAKKPRNVDNTPDLLKTKKGKAALKAISGINN